MANPPQRRLTLFDTVMIVSGSMIGSGIFIVSAEMTRVLGSPMLVLACWVITGIITLFAALSYGELAGMMPEAGGQFVYIRRAFGDLTAFLYGWTVFTVIQTGVIAAVAFAFARYMAVFIPYFSESHALLQIGLFKVTYTQLLAVAMIMFLTWTNTTGLENGKIIQRLFTSTKLIALALVILVGFIMPDNWSVFLTNLEIPFTPSPDGPSTLFSALGVALVGSLFSSDAWNNVTFIAGEVIRPQRNIFLGLLIGVLIVTGLYLLVNVAYFNLLPAGIEGGSTVIERGVAYADNERVGSAALQPVLGSLGGLLMAGLIVISTFGCNNGLILSGARLFSSMAAASLFFPAAARMNKNDVPHVSLWYQGAWASVLCLSGTYGSLLDYCIFASLLFYIITILGLFRLRVIEPNAERPYKVLGYPIVPALYVLIAVAICVNLLITKPTHPMIGLGIILLGIPAFFFFKKRYLNRI